MESSRPWALQTATLQEEGGAQKAPSTVSRCLVWGRGMREGGLGNSGWS